MRNKTEEWHEWLATAKVAANAISPFVIALIGYITVSRNDSATAAVVERAYSICCPSCHPRMLWTYHNPMRGAPVEGPRILVHTTHAIFTTQFDCAMHVRCGGVAEYAFCEESKGLWVTTDHVWLYYVQAGDGSSLLGRV